MVEGDAIHPGRYLRLRSDTSSWTFNARRLGGPPGRPGQARHLIPELADPQLQQQLLDAENQRRASETELASLRARLDTERLNQKSMAATVEADSEHAPRA